MTPRIRYRSIWNTKRRPRSQSFVRMTPARRERIMEIVRSIEHVEKVRFDGLNLVVTARWVASDGSRHKPSPVICIATDILRGCVGG